MAHALEEAISIHAPFLQQTDAGILDAHTTGFLVQRCYPMLVQSEENHAKKAAV